MIKRIIITKFLFVCYLFYIFMRQPCKFRRLTIGNMYSEFNEKCNKYTDDLFELIKRYMKCLCIYLFVLKKKLDLKIIQVMKMHKHTKNKECCNKQSEQKQINQKQVTTLGNRNTDYYVLSTDELIQIYNTSSMTVILPKAFTNGGKEIIISKISDNEFPINIVAFGGGTIDGLNTNIFLNNYLEKIMLISNGINIYYII